MIWYYRSLPCVPTSRRDRLERTNGYHLVRGRRNSARIKQKAFLTSRQKIKAVPDMQQHYTRVVNLLSGTLLFSYQVPLVGGYLPPAELLKRLAHNNFTAELAVSWLYSNMIEI